MAIALERGINQTGDGYTGGEVHEELQEQTRLARQHTNRTGTGYVMMVKSAAASFYHNQKQEECDSVLVFLGVFLAVCVRNRKWWM